MPKSAVSNIALPAYDHREELRRLPGLGIEGLEVAPSRVWRDTWHGLKPADVGRYRRQVETAGLRIIGLHSLFWDQPKLGLFRGPDVGARTLDFLTHLSALCRDLGGRTLIYGSGPARRRGALSLESANAETIDFFGQLCLRIEGHATCYCFEPLAPEEADFINSAFDSLAIVETVNHPALRMQLDAKALVANDEVAPATFRAAAPFLVHFHANEPGLVALGDSGRMDHALLGRLLREIGYEGYVSIEQRLLNESDPVCDVARSAAVLREHYGGPEGRPG